FVYYENKIKHPLVDFSIFKNRGYSGATISNFLLNGVAGGALKAKNERQSDNPEFKKAMGILIVSTVGYVGFVVLGDIFGVCGTDALFFQSVGMAIGCVSLSMNHKTSRKSTALNLLPGVIGGIGNLFMF
ncbi:GRP family sugar transporter, partial [Staphylococcus aureus]|uniref:GRP family sugar transporter n=1 Tax=Staphylococcus aureus TaxID=1280 RepID=UPI00210F0A47